MSAAAPSHPGVRPAAGIGLLLLSTWALSGLDSSGKWSMGLGIPLLVLSWVRYAVHLAIVLPLVLPLRGRAVFRSRCPRDQLMRGLFMLLATFSYFTSLARLPQAQATAINFLAPLIVLALAPWVLKEPARLSRWVAALAGFVGILIIIRPSGGLDPIGVAAGLTTAALFAGQYIYTRRVARDDPLLTLVWSGGVGTIALTAVLPFIIPDILYTLRMLEPLGWIIMLSTGFWGALGHLLQIQAYQNAPASMLAPFVYTQIIAAAALGWLIWGQFPDGLTWLGIAIICASGIGIGALEWHRRDKVTI